MQTRGPLPVVGPVVTSEWMGHVEWGPGHMRNDTGPATVVVTDEDRKREAAAAAVQRAIERALERGEENDYDE